MKIESCISKNQKTIKSFDCTSNCPKRRAHNECKYCYVSAARRKGWKPKFVYDYKPYQHEVLRYKKVTIDKLNKAGGIRMFSFGDYMKEHDNDIKMFLDDCETIKLKVKTITKQVSFIDKYHEHKAIAVIHISVDTIGCGVPHDVAKAYRAKYDKVRIRAVILQDSDIIDLSFSDVYTYNHASNVGFHRYGTAERIEKSKEYGILKKTCCLIDMEKGENCTNCRVKCSI